MLGCYKFCRVIDVIRRELSQGSAITARLLEDILIFWIVKIVIFQTPRPFLFFFLQIGGTNLSSLCISHALSYCFPI